MRRLVLGLLGLTLSPAALWATPQNGSFANENGAVIFVEKASDQGFDFTLSSAPTCPEGETQCLSIEGHATAGGKGFAYVDPNDPKSRIFFAEASGGLQILSTTGDLGSGSANHAVLLVLRGTYQTAAAAPQTDQAKTDQTQTDASTDDDATAEGIASFQTPSHNIGCQVIYSDRYEIRCDMAQLNKSFVVPPKDCGEDWGDSFTLAEGYKPAALVCHGDTVIFPDAEVLDYGTSKSFGGLTCVSDKSGLTCRSTQGHGFALSRKGQSLF